MLPTEFKIIQSYQHVTIVTQSGDQLNFFEKRVWFSILYNEIIIIIIRQQNKIKIKQIMSALLVWKNFKRKSLLRIIENK